MVLESNTLDVLFVKDGQQGEDGKILYTWIKYAKDANGTGMTDDPNGAVYIGISYNNESSIESNDPTQYAWTKIQGAEGKKGEDAYTIFLENENISFATDENRDPLSEQAYTSGITIMKGAKPVTDFTIGDIAKTQGIAVAKTDTAIAISVINGNPLPSDNGEIVIPITVGGTVFKKILSWTCSKKGDKGIQGIQGPQGVQGEKGKDGTSVTISNKSITYQLSASGTVVPTGTWQTSPQTIPEGQYQWTKTSVTYSDGNKTESYSISYRGKNGSDGTSVKTTSTSVKYQVGDSGTIKPTGTWQNSVPTVAQGKYLWTQTIVNYSDGNSTESYSVSYRGIDGSNGVNGMNAATVYLYQRATSTPSKPSNTLTYTFSTTKITGTLNNGWSTAIPTGTDAVYVTVASVSSKNDTATIATSAWSAPVVLAQNGKTGSDGKAGLNVATIYLYQRSTSKPSKPSASVTYTFSTGVASGLNNGWSQKIPDGANPLYVTLATASSNTATDTILSSEWSDVVVMAQNGEDGQDGISPKVSLSKSGDTTTISIVDATGTHTQTVKDGTNGTPGADGKDGKTSYFHVKYSNDGGKTFTGSSGEDTGIYMGSYTDYTEGDSTDVSKYTWVKVKGDKGDTGQKGQDGTSIKITSKSVTYQTSTSGTTAPTGTWSTTVPTVNNGQYLWTKTTVQYSDGNKTEAYSVSYKGTNGTNGTSVTVSKTEVTYQVSTSGTTAPTGTWSTTMPSCDQGQYLWTKTYVKYSDGKDTTSYSVSYKGVDGEKFAFNMLRETNQGSKHWVNMGASGKYSVESITTEDSINAVKLICTEPIASNEWQFCDFSDYEMLKSLKASTTYTLSYDIKTNRSGKILHNIKTGGGQKMFFANDIACKVLGNETWEHVSLKMTSGTTLPNLDGQVIYMFGDALSKVGYSIIKNLKLTEGIIDTPWAPHPEDLEGRGVSETVQYYLATSQASGVTSSTSGWSTDITTQKLTADKKYLWNCYQTKYSDGTSEPISTPKVIGVYGDKGQKGDSGEDGQDGAGFHWNLLSGTKDFDKTKMSIAGATSFDSQKYLGLTVIKAVSPTSGYIDPVAWNSTITPTPNTQYTISFYAKASVKTLVNSYFYPNCTIKCISNHQTTTAPDGAVSTMLSTEWERYSVTWTTSGSVSGTKSIIPVRLQHGISVDGATVYLCGVKLEQSDKPSPWCTTYEETLAKNLSITPSSQYFKSTDGGKTFTPDTITIKPTIQGEISFGKWQYSIDGGVSFADIVSGQKGLTINNNVLTVSKDSSLYSDAVTMVTFRAVANDSSFYDTCSIAKIYDVSDIGDGRNLLWNSNFAKTDEAITGTTNSWGLHTRGTNLVASIDTSTKHNGFNTLKTVSAANGDKNSSNDLEWFAWGISERTSDNLHSKNQNYTLSFYAKASVTTDFIVRWGYDAYGADTTRTLTTNWQKYEIKLHQATSAYSITIIFKLLTAGTVWFSEFKLEKGSSATGYSTAPEDLQTAILSTKSEISDVSLKVDNNKQAIEQRVEKTTYQQDLKLVKGDISKANEGLNKWRYEIYPKSLFADKPDDQSKYDIGVFIRNKNLTPSQNVLLDDTSLSTGMDYGDSHIAYGLTFIKMSAAKSITTTFYNDDGASFYVNGKQIISTTANYTSGTSITFTLVQGWNCLEVVLNQGDGSEGFSFSTTLSALSECQLMNCYYGTPVARQSHITNQLVQNTTDIDGISGSVQQVMSTVGGSGKVDEFVNNYSTWKKKVDDIETRVGKTYVTKDDFNGLEIGGRNLILNSAFKKGRKEWSDWGNPTTREIVSSNGKSWAHIVGNQQNYQGFNQWTPAGSIKEGDHITFSARIKGNAANQRFTVGIHWLNSGNTIISQDWHTFIVDTTENVYTWTVNASGSGCNKLNLMVGVSDPSIVYNVYFTEIMVVKGNKATDWAPAPEDDEINGQNLVSNLPSNWEQGSFDGSRVDVGGTYSTGKVDNSTIIRVKELVPVSGSITISNAYSNQSKKPIQHYIVAFDVDKKYLGSSYVSTAWNDFPKIVDMKDAKYIAVIVRYKDESAITPSDISQICLKIERGTSATPFTLASEDVNGKIVNVETIANQTAKKFEWIVKGGDSSSNFTLTDRVADLVADRINFNGLVKFSGLNTDAKNEIGKVAQSKVDGLDVGGRNLALQSKDFTSGEQYWSINSNFTRSVDSDGFTVLSIKRSGAGLEWNRAIPHNYIPVDEMHRGIIVSFDFMCDKVSELDRGCICALQIFNSGGGRIGWYESQDILSGAQCKLSAPLSDGKWIRVQIPFSEGDLKATYGNSDAVAYTSVSFNLVANGSIHFKKIKIEYGNKATDWTPAPEDYLPQVDLVSNWTTNTTWIDGGKIYTNSITADKIATDAIKSRNYISSGGTQGSFLNLSDGSFQSPNLSWDSNGNLIAKNANIIGNLTAGTVGEWKIDKYIYSRDKMFFDINKHNGQSIYNKNSTNNLFLGDGKVSSFYWFTTQNNTFIIENGNSPQYATGPAGISFGTNIAQGQIELYESVYPGNIIQDYEQTSHTSELSISGSKISFSYYDSNGSSFSDSPYTYIMADYARFYGDIFVQGSITTDEGVDVGGKLQASSIATKNGGLIETAGTVYGGGEIQCGGGQMRIIGGNYGILLRNDGSDFYILSTDSGSPWGSWNSKRPFRINLANGIPYFEYGIIIPNENYLLGNGYQLARGTSWGGVCIGDDSKGLRLYGTSIWASHSISTSDENLKENFTTLDQYEDFYMNLNPIGFNYIGDYDGKKTHFGFGAHKTEDILESEGYDSDKFAVVTHRPLVQEDIKKRFGKDVEVDIETEYGVSYTEFIALNTHMIQKTRRELEQVKQEKADLEARLQAIEAKLRL